MKKSIEEGRLINVTPGRYLRAGSDNPAMIDLFESAKGIVVDEYREPGGKEMVVVLVGGQLINMWRNIENKNSAAG